MYWVHYIDICIWGKGYKLWVINTRKYRGKAEYQIDRDVRAKKYRPKVMCPLFFLH